MIVFMAVYCVIGPNLFSFILDTPHGYKVFSEPETIPYKKNKQICFEYYTFSFRR